MKQNPDSTILATAEYLARHLNDHDLRIVDTRQSDGFDAAHIDGAVALNGSSYLRENGDVIPADQFAHLMSRLGMDRNTNVIVYDDGNNLFATRLWWVLNYYGHHRVKVLDGGWDNWVTQSFPVNNHSTEVDFLDFSPQIDRQQIATTSDVQAAIGLPRQVILDVRGDKEWQRTEATPKSSPGHIPGAVHLVWSQLIDPETMCFKPKNTLCELFEAHDIHPQDDIITYCHAGIRAAHTLFALKLAEFNKVRNYEGSWLAWTHAECPVELNQ
ncbi:MAG: sulfurtransferase [Porticoccaceae bacterium]|nr:sulfurtransferase [Porticoccaceae bacterium]